MSAVEVRSTDFIFVEASCSFARWVAARVPAVRSERARAEKEQRVTEWTP